MSFHEQLRNTILTYDSKRLQAEINRINLEFKLKSGSENLFNEDEDTEEDSDEGGPIELEKEVNLLLGYCVYIFVKGRRKGKMCGNTVRNGGKFCAECSEKKGAKSVKYK